MMLVKLEAVLHVTPFHWQVGREGFQLERKLDGCLEMEALKDKRR